MASGTPSRDPASYVDPRAGCELLVLSGSEREKELDSQNRRFSAAHSPPDDANRRRVAFVGQCSTTAECDALHAARVGLFPMMVFAHRLPNRKRVVAIMRSDLLELIDGVCSILAPVRSALCGLRRRTSAAEPLLRTSHCALACVFGRYSRFT